MAKEFLNIVNENDEVIGIEDREVIHKKGMLHREVHIYFVTPNKEIIFQHRAKDKDTFPDLLDATAAGHVEIGDSYEKTAVKEILEETGLEIAETELVAVEKMHNNFQDSITGKTNHAFQQEFVYLFKGDVADLQIEAGKALGFESWPIEKLLSLDETGKARFIPYVYNFATTKLVEFLK